MSALPTAARTRASPRTRVPTTAPSGITLTVAAAAIGDTLQPATSSRTRRKRTALSAADTSARASAGRHENGGGDPGIARCAGAGPMSTATAASAAIGAWKMKIASQEKTSVSAPPSAGPIAVPSTAAPAHSRRPGPSPPPRIANTAIRPPAPPSAWPARATSSVVEVARSAHANDATAISASPPAPIARTETAPAARSSGSRATASTRV